MQALRERISSKLGEKSKSKDKDKDGASAIKSSTSADGKHTILSELHHHQGSVSTSTISASAASANVQSPEKGIPNFLSMSFVRLKVKIRYIT
jgi:hypothetical protein